MIQWLSLACAWSIRKNHNRPDPKTYSAKLDSPMTQNADFTSRLPSKHLDAAVSDGYFIHQMPPAVNAQEIKAGLYTQQRNPGIKVWYGSDSIEPLRNPFRTEHPFNIEQLKGSLWVYIEVSFLYYHNFCVCV